MYRPVARDCLRFKSVDTTEANRLEAGLHRNLPFERAPRVQRLNDLVNPLVQLLWVSLSTPLGIANSHWALRPCRVAFCELRRFPASVRGPVDLPAFLRLACT